MKSYKIGLFSGAFIGLYAYNGAAELKSLRSPSTVRRTSKILWGNRNEEKTNSLLRLNKMEINNIIGILTRHLVLQVHLQILGVAKRALHLLQVKEWNS